MELIDLVNSAQISNNLNFATWIPDSDSHSPALLDFSLFSGASICSTMACSSLGNADHVVSVFIDFPSNFKGDALFYCIAYDHFEVDWLGWSSWSFERWEDIFKVNASSAACEFCEWLQSGIDIRQNSW